MAADPGLDLAIVEARNDLDSEVDPAAHALEDPEQLQVGLRTATRVHRETVDQLRLAAVGAKGRLQDQGVRDVGLEAAAVGFDRADQAVPAQLPVQQPPEDAG